MIGNVFDVDLKMIRIFCAIVDSGGFTAAHFSLNISMPRLSTTISDLEARLGVRLCDRGRNGFRLTSEGAAIYDAAQILLRDLDKFRERLANMPVKPAELGKHFGHKAEIRLS